MKTVFGNDMCAHVWAQQNPEQWEGRSNSGNLSFNGPVIRSYATPIAAFHMGTRGRRFVLVTSESFSITTNGSHMPAVRHALNYDGAAFRVPHVWNGYNGRTNSPRQMDNLHAANVAYLEKEVSEYAARMRKFHVVLWDVSGERDPGQRVGALVSKFTNGVSAYCEAFGIRKGAADRARALESLCEGIHTAHTKYMDPKSAANHG